MKQEIRLKVILKSKGISTLELSRITGIAANTLCNIINGKQYPYPGWRKKISLILGMPEKDIFPELYEED